MDYPHILGPVNEIYNRIVTKIGENNLTKSIIIGDFNAGKNPASSELKSSSFSLFTFNTGNKNDRVLFGNEITSHKSTYDESLKLLKTNINKYANVKNLWSKKETNYRRCKYNQELISSKQITSDHYPLLCSINL